MIRDVPFSGDLEQLKIQYTINTTDSDQNFSLTGQLAYPVFMQNE